MKKLVLMYHDVYVNSPHESGFDTNGANHYKISVKVFEEQLQVLSEMVSNQQLDKSKILLTFDDGGVSFYNVIRPLLDKYGYVGHFYISTNYIGTQGFLTEMQVKSLYEGGHIVGSHSSSHPSNLSALSDYDRIREWQESVEKLNAICGCNTKEISIPNGFFSKKDIELFKQVGISTVYTSLIGENKTIDGINVLGRIAVDAFTSIGTFKGMITGGWTFEKLVIRQAILQTIKYILGNRYIAFKKTLRMVIH